MEKEPTDTKEPTEPTEPTDTEEPTETVGEKDVHVSWNPKARLKLYEVDDGNRLRPYPERSPRDPAVVKLPKDKLVQRVFHEKPSRDIQVKRLEKKYNGGVPCEVREELISAFNVLAGLKKTMETHRLLYLEKGYMDDADAETERDLTEAFRESRTKARDLMARCGFPGTLKFGKLKNVSNRRRQKIKRILDLLS
jgi:hypothetical protein